MPEGDTLHKVAAVLRPLMVGQPLLAAQLGHGRAPLLLGRTVLGVEAHGKHLVVELGPAGGGWCLRVHLGMYGSWHRYAPREAWRRPRRQAQVVLEVLGHTLVCFNAQDVELWPVGGRSDVGQLEALGPNLLAAEVDLHEVVRRARRRQAQSQSLSKMAWGDLLLDQQVAAGLGNVYRCELLFLHRLSPAADVAAADDALVHAVYRDACRLLRQNLGAWRRTTTYDRRRGKDPNVSRLFVYGRRQQPCLRCGQKIAQARMGRRRRSTYWCPACQDLPAPSGENRRRRGV